MPTTQKKISTSDNFSFKSKILPMVASSCIAGLPADFVTMPFSRIRTLVMTHGLQNKKKVKPTIPVAIKQIYKGEGLKGFYRGMSPVLTASIPGTTLFFLGKELSEQQVGQGWYTNAVTMFMAQLSGTVVWVPMETLRDARQFGKMDIPPSKANSSFSIIKYIIQTNGVSGLYRGLIPQLATFAPFNILGVSFSDAIRQQAGIEKTTQSVGHSLATYGLGYALSSFLTNPIDRIKMEVQLGVTNKFIKKPILKTTSSIYTNSGIRGFFDGAVSRALWLGPRQAIAFTVFGKVRELLLQSNQEDTALSEREKIRP